MWRASIAGLCPFHVWKEMTVDSCGCLKKLPLYSNSVKECTIVISSFGELMVQWDLAVNSRGKSLNGKTKPLELLFIHVSNLWLDWRLHFASGSYFSWIFLVNFICSFIHFFFKGIRRVNIFGCVRSTSNHEAEGVEMKFNFGGEIVWFKKFKWVDHHSLAYLYEQECENMQTVQLYVYNVIILRS